MQTWMTDAYRLDLLAGPRQVVAEQVFDRVWRFDFTAPGSASEQLARDRAALALHPDTADQAARLWSNLIISGSPADTLVSSRLYAGAAETLAPVFVSFGFLCAAWLLVAAGMLRRSA